MTKYQRALFLQCRVAILGSVNEKTKYWQENCNVTSRLAKRRYNVLLIITHESSYERLQVEDSLGPSLQTSSLLSILSSLD